MAKFLVKASYTLEGVKGVQRAGGTSRREAIAQMTEGLGGKPEEIDAAAQMTVDYRPPGS